MISNNSRLGWIPHLNMTVTADSSDPDPDGDDDVSSSDDEDHHQFNGDNLDDCTKPTRKNKI